MDSKLEEEEGALDSDTIVQKESYDLANDQVQISLLSEDREAQSVQLSVGFLSPKMILIVFSTMMVITYYDRGGLSSCISKIQKELDLSNTKAGLLQALFMLGYVLSSPLFAQYGAKYFPLKKMAFGLVGWCVAVTLCGFSNSLIMLIASRALTGVGEASFICLAPTFINLAAPPAERSLWLSIFYTSIPVGYALGYISGGYIVGSNILGSYWTWRLFFFSEALLMIPFIIVSLICKGPKSIASLENNENNELESEEDPFSSTWTNIKFLLYDQLYMFIILGYAAQTFVVGGVAFFGVKYSHEHLGYSIDKAGMYFGAVTLFAGILGTACGGLVLDKLIMSKASPDRRIESIVQALYTMLIVSIIAIPFCIAPFYISSAALFFPTIALGEFFLFSSLSPTNAAIIWSVPLQLQPLAVAVGVFFIHVLGDAISPVIIGALLDKTNSWQISMTCLSMMLGPSVLLWIVALWVAKGIVLRDSMGEPLL